MKETTTAKECPQYLSISTGAYYNPSEPRASEPRVRVLINYWQFIRQAGGVGIYKRCEAGMLFKGIEFWQYEAFKEVTPGNWVKASRCAHDCTAEELAVIYS